MKKETEQWLKYAEENRQSAEILLKSGLINSCLQNCQQAIEKYLKALLVERSLPFVKTHSIRALVSVLRENNMSMSASDDEMDLIDSIYLPSKYPLFSVLPDFTPDAELGETCLRLLQKLRSDVMRYLDAKKG